MPAYEDPTVQLRVRYAETDQMGIAHHAVYPVWMEAGRVQWMRAHGVPYMEIEASGVALSLSGLEVLYRRPARFDDLVSVETRLTDARSRSLRFEYRLERRADGALLATGATVHVPTNPDGRAVRLSERWLRPFVSLLESQA